MPPGDAIPQEGRCSALAPVTGSALFEQGSTVGSRKRESSSSPGTLLFFSRVGPRGDVLWASFFVWSVRLSLEFGATARVFRRSTQMSHAAVRRNPSGRALFGIGSSDWIGLLPTRFDGAKQEAGVFIFSRASSSLLKIRTAQRCPLGFFLRPLNPPQSRVRCRRTSLPPISVIGPNSKA
jgi:hypothetical protein